MKRLEFLKSLKSPLPNAILKKYPKGNIMQYWADNPAMYAAAFGQVDDLHVYLGGHSGIDISTFHRDPVYAAHDGYVRELRTDRTGLGGLVVWIMSDPLDEERDNNSRIETAYGHLDEIAVKLNQRVKQGQIIGYEGNTGMVVSGGNAYWGNAPAGVGTHLHFSLYEYMLKDGALAFRYSNPMQNSTDPLAWISDPTPQDGIADGNLSGWAVVLQNAARYLQKKFGSSPSVLLAAHRA